MSNLYLTNQAKINWALSALGTSPTLAGSKLHLYKTGIILTPGTTLAELEAVQATFPGYVPRPLVGWTDPVIIDAKAITEPDAVTWQATASTPGSLFGCYLTNGAGDRLLCVMPFVTPVPIPFTSEFQVSVQLSFDSFFHL